MGLIISNNNILIYDKYFVFKSIDKNTIEVFYDARIKSVISKKVE